MLIKEHTVEVTAVKNDAVTTARNEQNRTLLPWLMRKTCS